MDPSIERRLAAFMQYGADVILVHDEHGTIFFAGPSLPRILGYEVGELVGQRLIELVHEDDRAAVDQQRAAMLANPGVPQAGRFRIRHKGGAWRWLEGTGINQLADATMRGLVLNKHDITERRTAEEAVRQS